MLKIYVLRGFLSGGLPNSFSPQWRRRRSLAKSPSPPKPTGRPIPPSVMEERESVGGREGTDLTSAKNSLPPSLPPSSRLPHGLTTKRGEGEGREWNPFLEVFKPRLHSYARKFFLTVIIRPLLVLSLGKLPKEPKCKPVPQSRPMGPPPPPLPISRPYLPPPPPLTSGLLAPPPSPPCSPGPNSSRIYAPPPLRCKKGKGKKGGGGLLRPVCLLRIPIDGHVEICSERNIN